MAITQKNRAASIKTPLGSDVLVLKSLKGGEELGRLFQFELELISEDYDIDFDKIIGEKVTISLYIGDNDYRFFNGFVSRFVQMAPEGGYARYQATVVPWLWLLTRTSDCRIFQSKAIPDILEEVFKGHGFDAYERRLSGKYTPWDYCVQYRETDFNFVSRLMEQEGIYYYFKHADGKHTLVLADSPAAHDACPDYEEIAFRPPGEADADGEYIRDWVIDKELQTGVYAHTDFNFEKPKASLRALSNIPRQHAAADLEMFDYPGEYDASGDGEDYAKIRIQEIQARHETLHGQTDARGICNGFTFKLKDYGRKDQNRKYLVTAANHAISVDVFESGGEAEEPFYECSFSAIDASVPFRPARSTPKPIVQGPQTAIVVGPSAETIHTDKYGRVKVQFHWDRHGKADANSSCWIRVSQNWGGKNWGGMFIPHVGQEMIVSFLEGDPDQPIITGRVYNADQMPPLDLPANKTKSAIRDHGGNEIIMEGAAGKQQMRLHSPTHDSNITLGNSIRIHSLSDLWSFIKGNHNENIEGNKKEEIKGETEEVYCGPFKLKRKADWNEMTLGATHETFVGAKSDLTVGTLLETRMVNHTEVKVGSHFEVKKAVHASLERVKELKKNSKLQELIKEHREFTETAHKKFETLEEKVKKKREEAEDTRIASTHWKGEIGEEYKLQAATLSQKADKLEHKAKQAKADYDSCTIDCSGVLKLC